MRYKYNYRFVIYYGCHDPELSRFNFYRCFIDARILYYDWLCPVNLRARTRLVVKRLSQCADRQVGISREGLIRLLSLLAV